MKPLSFFLFLLLSCALKAQNTASGYVFADANGNGKKDKTEKGIANVPISIKKIGLLESTQDDILTVLEIQKQKPFTKHLEVETYTWEVLPESLKLPITQSISNELQWVVNTEI